MDKKTTEAQRRASRVWEKNNKEKARINSYRRSARLFIRSHAELEDLEELEELIRNKRKEL